MLVQSAPQTVQEADDHGTLPLHVAAQMSSLSAVQFLYHTHPGGIDKEDNEGLLPFHWASKRSDQNLNLDVVQFMLQCNGKN